MPMSSYIGAARATGKATCSGGENFPCFASRLQSSTPEKSISNRLAHAVQAIF